LQSCDSDKFNGTYALNGTTLTLIYTDDVADEVYEVVSLTATELKLKRAASLNRTTMSSTNYYTFTKR
jgi:hypothetical protein